MEIAKNRNKSWKILNTPIIIKLYWMKDIRTKEKALSNKYDVSLAKSNEY